MPELSFLGGLLLGLASSLHCAAMCGPIASSYLLVMAPQDRARARLRVLLTAQVGRAISYCVAGAILGAAGAHVVHLFDRAFAFRIMEWIAALTLMGIGLSVAGLLPSLAGLDRALPRLFSPITQGLGRLAASASLGAPPGAGEARLAGYRLRNIATPLVSGMVWGMVPCGMVYAALFTAMLAGSAGRAALIMAGFALGTVPSVTVSALGVTALPKLARKDRARLIVGLAIVMIGVATLWAAAPGSALFCVPPS